MGMGIGHTISAPWRASVKSSTREERLQQRILSDDGNGGEMPGDRRVFGVFKKVAVWLQQVPSPSPSRPPQNCNCAAVVNVDWWRLKAWQRGWKSRDITLSPAALLSSHPTIHVGRVKHWERMVLPSIPIDLAASSGDRS